jgi:signal transduction histidine kinase/CheY-like chemotaxis protein
MALLWGRDGILLYNDAYAELAEPRHPAALGARVAEAWPELAELHAGVIARVLDGEAVSFRDLPLPLRRPEAGTATFNLDVSPVPGPDGRPAGALAVLAETTEAVMGRQALGRAEAEARRSEDARIASIETIAGGFAHDFNNLLTPVVAGLDIVRRKLPDERSQRLITGALQSAERAATLVQRLLAFAGRQFLQPRAISASGLLEGMRDLIAASLPPGVELRMEVPADLPAVQADPAQLEIALLNLAANARDAMPAGGRLTIGAEVVDAGEDPVPGLPPGRYISLAVSDTGTGMDAATLKRAIEPFFTTKPAGQGTGLGLSLVHGFATQSGGGFRLLSEVGRGTAAVMFLPLAQEMREAGPGEGDERESRALVLLVDDEDLVRTAMAEGLRDLGYDVEEVGTAAEALEAIGAGFRPDVLVTDHVMPGMKGAELAREARQRLPALPVLMITGYAQIPPEETRGFHVMSKPFRQAELALKLALMLDPAGDNVVPMRPRGGQA